MDRQSKSVAHQEYLSWLREAGPCFSPLHASTLPSRFGSFESWTVEGLYQGLKLIEIRDASLVSPALRPVVYTSGPPARIHFPELLRVRENLKDHPAFRVCKSGPSFDGKRNRYLGRLPNGDRNWAMPGLWIDPNDGVAVDRETFLRRVFVPAFRAKLLEHPSELEQLSRLWSEGRCPITQSMVEAHDHLRIVLAVMTEHQRK